MTSEDIALVQESWRKIEPVKEIAAELFYAKLFELDPPLQLVFGDDLKDRHKRFTQILGATVRGVDASLPIVKADYPTADAPIDHERLVYWRELGAPVTTPVYWGSRLAPWMRLHGPTIVEYPHTTIAVRPGQSLHLDDFGNIVLTLEDQP